MKKGVTVLYLTLMLPLLFGACSKSNKGKELCLRRGLPYPIVVAHRGASYDAPASTEAAYRLARNLGAHYLETDIQRTKDGILVCIHDSNLSRISNIEKIFPQRIHNPVGTFTYDELLMLDFGSWFNSAPTRSFNGRSGFQGLKVCTLDEVLNIAEGKRATGAPDPQDNGNRPGICIETKLAPLYPGIERDIKEVLLRRGWMGAKSPLKTPPAGFDASKNVAILYSPGRVVIQSYEPSSLAAMSQELPHIPKLFMMWLYTKPHSFDESTPMVKRPGPWRKGRFQQQSKESVAQYTAKFEIASQEEYEKWLLWAQKQGAVGISSPSTSKFFNDPVRGNQSWMNLIEPWMNKRTHSLDLFVLAHTIDSKEDIRKAVKDGVDGIITNRPNVVRDFYKLGDYGTPDNLLSSMGYGSLPE